MHVPEGWRLIKLGDLLSFKNGINADAGAYGVGTKFVNLLDIFNNKYLHYKDIVGKVNATDKQREDYSVKKGDILFNRTSEIREEIAFSSVYFDEKEAVFGGFVIRGRPEKKWIDKDYSIYAFRHEYFRNQVVRMAQGAVRANIGQKDLSVVNLLLPPIAEQEKIAEILSTWDHAIEQTERLKANAETHKQALMQQLLTGKKRFPEFEGEWEAKVLGDIVKISKGQQKNRIDLTANGKYPVINGGIEPSGYTDEYNRMENIITISEGGNSCGYVNFIKTKFWCGGHCYSMLEPSIDNHFLFHALKFREKALMQLRVGSGLPNIQKRDVESFKIKYPKITEEQQKIAAVLSAADREIELLAQKLDHLKTEKRALMQQLLTGKRRVKVDG